MPPFARQVTLAAFIHRRCRPLARRALARWEERANAIPDAALRGQALASQRSKGFHCEGGAVYGAGTHAHTEKLIAAIVAYQTLVDYLDNLSDRSGEVSEESLRRMHTACADALTPGAPLRAYVDGNDGGYLHGLVAETQAALSALPGYASVQAHCHILANLYAELQVLKHLPDKASREPALITWLSTIVPNYPGWHWWELAAACGSTLGLFALFRAAVSPDAAGITNLLDAYFPWICGLHILLDYYVDQAEDREGGDFNLVEPYGNSGAAIRNLHAIVAESRRRVLTLPDPALHYLVVEGLPGLYLSDPKVARQGLGQHARQIIRAGGSLSLVSYWYCRAFPPIR